jgi:histidine ammonia-lyase
MGDGILKINGESLSLEDLVAVARKGKKVALTENAKKRMDESRSWVEKVVAEGEPVVYGVNTGFGSLAGRKVLKNKSLIRKLQRNLILSHAAGVGNPFSHEIVRAAILLRANSLAKGNSGVRIELVTTLLSLLNKDVIPMVPEKGSVGASGDLAPLAHIAVVISMDPEMEVEGEQMLLEESKSSGERVKKKLISLSGEAFIKNGEMYELKSGIEAMAEAGIPRMKLEAKEGLALTNGAMFIAAMGALAVNDATILAKSADIIGALSLEAMLGFESAFSPLLHQARPHPGSMATADNIMRLIKGSRLSRHIEEIQASMNIMEELGRVQDPYSLRCIPQVHGTAKETILFVKERMEREMNSATDNPLIFPDSPGRNKAFSGGNFHGDPVGIPLDFLGIALSKLGNISERRVFRLTDKALNYGLPSYLIDVAGEKGIHNGVMLAQYTAASLVSENKVLAHPSSVDSIPTSENTEDIVSMGTFAGRKTLEILKNLGYILAIEALTASQGIYLRLKKNKGRPGQGTEIAYQLIREIIPPLTLDRLLYPDIEALFELIKSGRLAGAVEEAIGELRLEP